MTRHDHERKKRCLKVQSEILTDGKKKAYQRDRQLRENIAQLEEELLEPVDEIANTGEYFKTDNPFV
jgi:hypothetical protein